VEPAMALERRGEKPFHVLAATHVPPHETRIAATLADRIDDALAVGLVDVVDDHARALGGESRGDALAESRSAPGDDGDLVPQPHCLSSIRLRDFLPR